MVLAIEPEDNLTCWQLDYNTAFLSVDVAEEVYVKMALGYEQFDENGVPLVMGLLKSLYGLPPEPDQLVEHDRQTRGKNSLQRLQVGPVRLYLNSECGAICILTLHVDDVLLLGKDVLALTRINQGFMSRFSLTDRGNVSLVLGMGVIRGCEKGTVVTTQEKYTKSLLELYSTASCKSTYTPGVEKELSLDQPEVRLLSMEGMTAFPGHQGQRNVPWISDSLWHLIPRQRNGNGDV